MERHFFHITILLSCVFALLFIAGYFLPVGVAWGFHFLSFLPPYALALYIAGTAVCLVIAVRYDVDRILKPVTEVMERLPVLFLGGILLLFVLSASLFHIPAPLLGDSFTLLKNFHDFDAGISYLAPWNEPLSIFLLYYLTSLLGNSTFPAAVQSFFIVHLALGAVFITICFFIVRELFTSPIQRFLTFGLLIVLPYMTFFMGYIEVYSVSSVAFALFILCCVLSLNGRLSFIAVPISYALVTSSHVISALLGISVLYLAYREYRRGNRREVVAGFAIALFLMFILFLAVDFRLERLLDQSPISHFLSVTSNISELNSYSQAFTLFSWDHLIDLLNYFILMSPFALILLPIVGLRPGKNFSVENPVVAWGCLALGPVFLYLLDAKLEQGTANDWDTFAIFFALLNLITMVMIFRKNPQRAVQGVFLVVSITMLNSVTWFSVNAATKPSIRRFESLWDKRILSHLGRYTMSLRESRYYHAIDDTEHQIAVWEAYSATYPDDPRGYANTISTIDSLTPSDLARTARTYAAWYHIDPNNANVRVPYFNACLRLGDRLLAQDSAGRAISWYEQVVALDSSYALPYDRLGVFYTHEGSLGKALANFQRAIACDSTRGETYFHLALLYHVMQHRDEYVGTLRHAVALGDTSAERELREYAR